MRGRSGFDCCSQDGCCTSRATKQQDEGSTPSRSTYYCCFCDTHYEDQEDAIECCVAVEAAKVVLRNCGACRNGKCQCQVPPEER